MSFEKKFWENGDEVFPRDLNRYEDGIEELYVNGEQLSLDVGEFDTRIEQNTNQIQNLSSPCVIPEGTDIPVEQRTRGKIYFKVTSRQTGGGVSDEIKVSPNMGIKIV